MPAIKTEHLEVLIKTFLIPGIRHIIEKEVVSNQAVSGVYYFKDAKEFIHAAKSVIKFNKKTSGEFYVSSALQLLIYKGLKLRTYKAESIMIGTSEELERYLETLWVKS